MITDLQKRAPCIFIWLTVHYLVITIYYQIDVRYKKNIWGYIILVFKKKRNDHGCGGTCMSVTQVHYWVIDPGLSDLEPWSSPLIWPLFRPHCYGYPYDVTSWKQAPGKLLIHCIKVIAAVPFGSIKVTDHWWAIVLHQSSALLPYYKPHVVLLLCTCTTHVTFEIMC